MKINNSVIDVKIYNTTEKDGEDEVIWYGFICGTPDFTVEEAKKYLNESESQLPEQDPRGIITGIDEIEVYHIVNNTPITMLRVAMHSNASKKRGMKRDGWFLPREQKRIKYIGITQISKIFRPVKNVNEELHEYIPELTQAIGDKGTIVSTDLFMALNPADQSFQLLWRFGVEYPENPN